MKDAVSDVQQLHFVNLSLSSVCDGPRPHTLLTFIFYIPHRLKRKGNILCWTLPLYFRSVVNWLSPISFISFFFSLKRLELYSLSGVLPFFPKRCFSDLPFFSFCNITSSQSASSEGFFFAFLFQFSGGESGKNVPYIFYCQIVVWSLSGQLQVRWGRWLWPVTAGNDPLEYRNGFKCNFIIHLKYISHCRRVRYWDEGGTTKM